MTTPHDYPDNGSRFSREGERRKEKLRHAIAIIRNVLNLLFILVAVAGMVCYFYNREMSTMLICVDIVLKFAESAMRILRL